jgi:hypothetical protein
MFDPNMPLPNFNQGIPMPGFMPMDGGFQVDPNAGEMQQAHADTGFDYDPDMPLADFGTPDQGFPRREHGVNIPRN